jgi:membrane-bound serine protease (ClpP class)
VSPIPILLLLASLALLAIEVLIVSFGLISLLAIGCGVGGIMLAFRESAVYGWSLVAAAVVGGPLTLRGAFILLPKLPFARGFYLDAPTISEEDRHAADATGQNLIGMEGEATSPLRPSGTALFGDVPRDVVTKGIMIAKGTRIRVVDVSGNRIVVEPIESESNPHSKA